MSRLKTRLDRDTRTVYWTLEGEGQEFSRLSDLLQRYNLEFDHADSRVVVKVIKAGVTRAELLYSVSYNAEYDVITLCGLLGTYMGEVFETFLRLGNEHIGFADRYDGVAQFHKYYMAIDDTDTDSESEYGDEGVYQP